jgi:hypothetical protein
MSDRILWRGWPPPKGKKNGCTYVGYSGREQCDRIIETAVARQRLGKHVIIARQQHGKNVSEVTTNHATAVVLLEAVLSM